MNEIKEEKREQVEFKNEVITYKIKSRKAASLNDNKRENINHKLNLLVTSKSVVEGSDVSHDRSFVGLSDFDEIF